MSEFDTCNGNCSSCGEDCSEGNATVTLTLDNDTTLECAILTTFQADGRNYIALLPKNEDGANGEVYIYRYSIENGTPVLENIEDDDEYEAASDGFDEWLDSLEYEELVSDEDLDALSSTLERS